MKMQRTLYYLLFFFYILSFASGEESITKRIREVVEHFKQDDPVGIPGAPIKDPMPIPDMRQSSAIAGTLHLRNASVLGLSAFRIHEVQCNLAVMQARIALIYSKIEVAGAYKLQNLWYRASGNFNITIIGLEVEAIAELQVGRKGNLEASHVEVDLSAADTAIQFENLGTWGNVIQGFINSVGPFVFDHIKPAVLAEFHTNVRGDVNTYLSQMQQTFPNSIPPLDLGIAKGRKFIRTKYDPYKAQDYKYKVGFFSVTINQIWLTGLASFYRLGNVSVSLSNNILQLDVRLSTKRLKGSCEWEASAGGLVSRSGAFSFSVDYIELELHVNQSLDVRNTPKLKEFQLKLGNIQLRMAGLGTMDYVLESMANIVPNILRYQIVDAVEGIIQQRIQDAMNIIDVEKELDNFLNEIDNNPNQNPKTELDPKEDEFDLLGDLADDID